MTEISVLSLKKDKQLAEINDQTLVRLAQKEIDDYRMKCLWKCPVCNKKISYKESLDICEEPYVHEMRCSATLLDSKKEQFFKCNRKMYLESKNNNGFKSIHFDELLARYHSMIIKESHSYRSVDSPDEIYSLLFSSFS